MSKFATTLVAAVCLLGFAAMPAQAAPVSGCLVTGPDPVQPGFDLLTCNANEASGDFIQIADPFGADDWFNSWVVMFEAGGAFSDVLRFEANTGANHTGPSRLTFWSNADAGFGAALTSALGASDLLRVLENPVGATTFYVNYQSNLNGAGGAQATSAYENCGLTNSGSCDRIDVFSIDDQPGDGNRQIPEPATLTLVGLGGAVAAYRRRKAGRTA